MEALVWFLGILAVIVCSLILLVAAVVSIVQFCVWADSSWIDRQIARDPDGGWLRKIENWRHESFNDGPIEDYASTVTRIPIPGGEEPRVEFDGQDWKERIPPEDPQKTEDRYEAIDKLLSALEETQFAAFCGNCFWGTAADTHEDAAAYIGIHTKDRPECKAWEEAVFGVKTDG